MPGRTLASWFGAVGDRVENEYQGTDRSFYTRNPQQPTPSHFATHPQLESNYGFYPVSQEGVHQYSENYAAAVNPYQVAGPHHGMSYNNPQQSLYGSALSPAASAHYGSTNHGGGQYAGAGGGSQQWPGGPQQQMGGSPTPSPAHTPPAPASQYHHHHRQWPSQGPTAGTQGPPGYYPRGAGPGPVPQHAHVGGPWGKSGHGHGQPGAGGTGPLFSLQLLVNQDMSRAAAAAAAAAAVGAGVGMPVTGPPGAAGLPSPHQTAAGVSVEGGVDLSADSYRRALPLAHRQLPQQLPPQAQPPTLALSQPQSQPLPLNGEVAKETVSVIAQTPRKPPMVAQPTAVSLATLETGRPSPDSLADRSGSAGPGADRSGTSTTPETTTSPSAPAAAPASSTSLLEQSTVAVTRNEEGHQLPPPLSQQQQPRPSPSPSPSPLQPKDLGPVSPVRSPKGGTIKRTKKVDSILENLVESGSKKSCPQQPVAASPGPEQPSQMPASSVVVAPASVIVSPAVTSEDSGGGNDTQSPSPGDTSRPQRPSSRSNDDGATSPSFNGSTDEDNGKPRRKRKLDKPVRVAKTSGEPDSSNSGTKVSASDEVTTASDSVDSSVKPVQEVKVEPTSVEPETTAEMVNVMSERTVEDSKLDDENKKTDEIKPLEDKMISDNKVVTSPIVSPKVECNKVTEETESDQQKDDNSEDLLSVLNSQSLEEKDVELKLEPKVEPKNAIIDVETELEKMFAGIVEDDSIPTDTVKREEPLLSATVSTLVDDKALECLTSNDPVPPAVASDMKTRTSKRGRPRGSRNSSRRSSESVPGLSSAENTPKKKKKRPAARNGGVTDEVPLRGKKVKKPKLEGVTCDSPLPPGVGRKRLRELAVATDSGSNASSGRSRGPVVHLEGPRDSPYRVTVVNGPARVEDDEGTDRKVVANASRRKNSSYHNDLEYRGKGGGGLFSSTLSARYDAHTTDPTWICVFCKRGPHSALGSGDLFGPYIVSRPEREHPVSADEKDIAEEQSRGGGSARGGKRSLRTAHMVEHFHQKMSRKAKRSHSIDGSITLAGMTPVGKDEGCYEVWTHEECAVWAAGVHLVGSRIVGLQEAVWGAMRTVCTKCSEGGASVSCVRRGCDLRAHYGCAQDLGWLLDEESYVAKCPQHKITKKGR